mgnify:CR=1 FL=1
MGRNANNIHIIVTCSSIEDFDKKTERIPSAINIYADVGGLIADKFGMRPMLQVINVRDILGGNEKNRNYSQQTIIGFFMLINRTIVKSPAYQPRCQVASIEHIKNCFENIEQAQFNVTQATSVDSYAADISEKELQTKYKKAWDAYVQEYSQQLQDLGKPIPEELQKFMSGGNIAASSSNAAKKKSAQSSSSAANKKASQAQQKKSQQKATTTKASPSQKGAAVKKSNVAATQQKKKTVEPKSKNVNADGTPRSKL